MEKKLDSPPRTRDSARTRALILDTAEGLILDHGYGNTTVDAVVGRAGITKGAFFHHFASKADLARALVDRKAAFDREHLERHLERARKLASDPLQRVLVVLGLFQEEFESLADTSPGCLFASYIYENKLFDETTLGVMRESTLMWREAMKGMLVEVIAKYPPRVPVEVESLADLFYGITQGSFIMTKTLGDKTLLARHAKHLRNYLELLFAPGPDAVTP